MEKLKNKTILIIGAGRLQIPAIRKAKEMGIFTIATDYDSHAHGLTLADDQIIVSTRDVDGSVREVYKYHTTKRKIDGVITVGTDASMTVAAVANRLRLPGIKFQDAEAASNKLKMRKRLKDNDVNCPNFFECWEEDDAVQNFHKLNNTVVVKPADNMGSRGVSKASNEEEVRIAFQFAKESTPSGEVIIEDYMDGPELSIDALIYNNKIYITGVADRIIGHPPYFVETGHIMPSMLPQEQIADAIDVMKKGIRALGIVKGAAKGDIKVTKDGAKVGEIAARLSGGFMSSHTFPYSSGVDLIGNAIRIALDLAPINMTPSINEVAMETAIIPKAGTIEKIENLGKALEIKGVEHIFMNVDIGDSIKDPKSNVEKAGHIIIRAKTRAEALSIRENALNTIKISLTK